MQLLLGISLLLSKLEATTQRKGVILQDLCFCTLLTFKLTFAVILHHVCSLQIYLTFVIIIHFGSFQIIYFSGICDYSWPFSFPADNLLI